MIRITFIEHGGTEHAIEAEEGSSLMASALSNNVPGIVADCGGALSCATCHVYVRPDWSEKVGRPGPEEKAMLEMAIDPNETSRLSCCITLSGELDGLSVDLPATQF